MTTLETVNEYLEFIPAEARLALKLMLYASVMGVGIAGFFRLSFYQKPDALKPRETESTFNFRVNGWRRNMFKLACLTGAVFGILPIYTGMSGTLTGTNLLMTSGALAMCAGALTPATFNVLQYGARATRHVAAAAVRMFIRKFSTMFSGEK